jgi:WD40 repeat protein
MLATASDDQTARIWEVTSGRELRTLDQFQYRVARVLFSPDSGLLAVAEHDEDVKAATSLWDPLTGQRQGSLDQQFLLTFSPDGRTMVTSGESRRVHFWDAETREDLGSFATDRYHTRAAAFDPNGTVLATDSAYDGVRLWDVADKREIGRLHGHFGGVQSVAFSTVGDLLASASDDGTVRLWDFHNRNLIVALRDQEVLVRCVTFSPDTKTLATCGDDGTVKVWNVNRHRLTFPKSVSSVVFLAEPDTLAIAGNDRTLGIWDVRAGKPRAVFRELAPEAICAVAFYPQRRLLGIGTVAGRVQLFDPALGELVEDWKRHDASVAALRFSPSSSLVAIVGNDRILRLCDANSGEQLLTTEAGQVLAFSSDGQKLAWLVGHTVKYLDTLTSELSQLAIKHEAAISSIAFSPDGKALATGSEDRRILLWDIAEDRMIENFLGHEHRITCLAFSPDGKTLVSGSEGGKVKLWNVTTGQELFPLFGHTGAVHFAVFDPNGQTLVTAADAGPRGGEVFVWKSGTN